ncbi:MAG: hypothetical protein B7Y47_14570 [Sphingomonas sp. 28-63-12]|nr:MAG: hypothetical protein B7Y47_14570 [Sphingomonas sp. 28-63-12]
MLGSAVVVSPALAQDYRGQSTYQQGSGYERGDVRVDARINDRGNDRGYNDNGAQLRQIGFRIERNVRAGTLTGREAFTLRREYAYLVRLDRKVSYGNASRWERTTLDRRTAVLARRLQQYRGNDYGDLRYGDGNQGDRGPGQNGRRN